ncbi:MAG: SdrD B-like domain-containing protein, partial [Candidatus Eisenbacteria bacterium]
MARPLPVLRCSMFAGLLALLAFAPPAAAISPPAYLLQWGTAGTGNGQFSDPAGVAVDASGNVYVADTGNNRIQKFSSAGVYVTQWGTAGAGNGQFSGPFGIAVAGGSVYVVDTGNNRVQVFSTAGAYLTQWGSAGTGNGQFQQPLCVAVNGSGDVYVTDYNLNRVQKFTAGGTYLQQWGTSGANDGEFNGMAGIAVDGWGQVLITDSGKHRVQQFSAAGAYQYQWGSLGTGNGNMNSPLGVGSNGVDQYVVDTINNRIQILTTYGLYLTQWGTSGSGNGQFNQPHSVALDGGFVYVADTSNDRIQKFGFPPVEECPNCPTQPDPCCEALPQVGGPWTNILVGTHQPHFFLPNPYAVTIYDLNASPLPAEDNDWASMTRYHGPGNSWTGDSLGSVFGLTLDEYGNIFVTHSSCYAGDTVGQVFNGGPGAVYRIDAVTGVITTFCVLPNLPDGSLTAPDNLPGLGNITYDCTHKQFFVTNLEDGKIYRIKPVGVNGTTGTVVGTFDPLLPDNGAPGWAPPGQRLWGVQWHGNRVYYSVWAVDAFEGTGPNEIRSVGLLPAGGFSTGSDQHEIFMPTIQGQTWSCPVADISFSTTGRMLLGERGIFEKTHPFAHAARVLEYTCTNNCWVPANHYLIGDLGTKENAEGGVDYDPQAFGGPASPIGRVWATGDALHFGTPYPDIIYGYQGLRPNLAFGSILNSMLVDADSFVQDQDKTFVGDVEAPGCVPGTLGSICGHKFHDLNRNGVADGPEPGISGWTITLNGPGGPYTATTDANGGYCFTNLSPGAYTINEASLPSWIQTGPAGGMYTVNLGAGQTLYGYDFGNYACNGSPNGCVSAPPMMVAWWPFNETVGSTSAKDAAHLTPARNVALLNGAAAISNGGQVQRA